MISRYLCKLCNRRFSSASSHACFLQKRRDLNLEVFKFLASAVSRRRTAYLLGTTRKTVDRKFLFLSTLLSKANKVLLEKHFAEKKAFAIQLDELETFEHTKCKPLSVPMIVEQESRIILGASVSVMPCSGKLAKISKAKYGRRADLRLKTLSKLLKKTKGYIEKEPQISSDCCPRYPRAIKAVFKNAIHLPFRGRRPRGQGFGELKKGWHDPLFSINHSFAMLRANINRLARRTWCTTKKKERLQAHLNLYIYFHNTWILGLAH